MSSSQDSSTKNIGNKQLNLGRLIAIIVGSTIGSGIFSLSGDFAAKGASQGAVLIAWAICGVGMISLSLSFQELALRKPELTGGIYTYAEKGFGGYVGFNSAWGYWVSALLCNVSYATLLFAAIGYFFPVFGEGNNLISIVCASAFIWFINYLCLRGTKEAATVNIVVTFSKILPIFIFILAVIFVRAFDFGIFKQNFWGDGSMPVIEQIKATMVTTVWSFIGIEGAVAISGRAKKSSDIGKATVGGFLGIFIIYVLISVLSMGIMPRAELAELGNPSLAFIFEKAVGTWGAVLINLGVIISLVGATLGWTIIASEMPYVLGVNGMFDKVFAKENKKNAPANALFLTNGVIEMFLIITFFNASTYQIFYALSTSMILVPYLLSALYLLKICITGEAFEKSKSKNHAGVTIVALIATIYAVWLIYAGGMDYLLITSVLYAPGTIVYYRNRKKRNQITFENNYEKVICGILVILAVISLVLIGKGTIKPF